MASDKNFVLGNMADDLVNITIELTGKKEDKTPRFPRYIYDSYVTRMMNITLDIQADIILSNELYSGRERQQMQKTLWRNAFCLSITFASLNLAAG